MRIALLQINPTVGDLAGNAALITAAAREAQRQGADLSLTPELALMGYLPRDLLMSHGFVKRSCEMLHSMARELAEAPPVLVGVATPNPAEMGRPLFNSAVLLEKGASGPAFHKTLLPTYDVFDEDRYFEPSHEPQILELHGDRLGISICEDVWNDRDFWQRPPLPSGPDHGARRKPAPGHPEPFRLALLRRQATAAGKDAGPQRTPHTGLRFSTSIRSAGTTT